MTLGGKAAVTGIGETDYTRDAGGRGVLTLQLEASLAAIADAGLRPGEIDGIVMPIGLGATVAEDFVTNFGIPDLRFSATTPLGGAGAVAALQCAVLAVANGLCRHVLLPLGRTGRHGKMQGLTRRDPHAPLKRKIISGQRKNRPCICKRSPLGVSMSRLRASGRGVCIAARSAFPVLIPILQEPAA